jgi:hypothetical protein
MSYYIVTGNPQSNSSGSPALIRAEFAAIAAGFTALLGAGIGSLGAYALAIPFASDTNDLIVFTGLGGFVWQVTAAGAFNGGGQQLFTRIGPMSLSGGLFGGASAVSSSAQAGTQFSVNLTNGTIQIGPAGRYRIHLCVAATGHSVSSGSANSAGSITLNANGSALIPNLYQNTMYGTGINGVPSWSIQSDVETQVVLAANTTLQLAGSVINSGTLTVQYFEVELIG